MLLMTTELTETGNQEVTQHRQSEMRSCCSEAANNINVESSIEGIEKNSFERSKNAEEDSLNESEISLHQANYDGLLPLLQRLDSRIAAAINVAEHVFAARAAGDLYRGLAISPADVSSALKCIPGETLLPVHAIIPALTTITQSISLQRVIWLQRVYGLSDVDIDVIIIGLAPEIDLRYERLYAYLQDHVTKCRPSVDLALNLICRTAAEKIEQRQRFASDAPLIKHRLIEVYTDPNYPKSPLLGRYFRLDEQIVRFLLLDDSLDSRLADFCQLEQAILDEDSAPLPDEIRDQITGFSAHPPNTGIRLYFQGPGHCGQDEAAALLAQRSNLRLLKADFNKINRNNPTSEILPVLVREAWLRSALLHIKTSKAPGETNEAIQLDPFWQALKTMPSDCVIEGEAVWNPELNRPLGVATVNFTYPATEHRKLWWQQCLAKNGLATGIETSTELAQRYRMTYAQIESASALAAVTAKASQPNYSDSLQDWESHVVQTLFTAARAQSGHELATLATKIEPRATWDDLVLPEYQIAQLHELCNRYIYRDKVLNEWGFAKKLSYGLGINALFSGASGTGKTMAAEVIANALQLDLYRIDLSRVVNKYIGETEKNLDRVFTAAANANAILFFDEADALFGKRSEVKDAHDRYANIEISYLLQRMEEYKGLAILATNLSDNLDQAFTRRLSFHIFFKFPNESERLHIWERIWPSDLPIPKEIDNQYLAQEIRLAGGNLKNIALTSAFLAASSTGILEKNLIKQAAEGECRKSGRGLFKEELNKKGGVQ
jgi:SpoVK/Ycf46/Vps4 family AAA+-type ATPase